MGSHFGSWSKIVSATAATHGSQVSCGKAPSFEPWKSSWLHSWLTRFSPSKLEMYGMMYSHDKMMMNSKPLGPTISGTNCFTGRYSPTYRVPEQMRDPMRRCMTNPPVSQFQLLLCRRQKANFCWLAGAHWILDLVNSKRKVQERGLPEQILSSLTLAYWFLLNLIKQRNGNLFVTFIQVHIKVETWLRERALALFTQKLRIDCVFY